MVRAFPSAVTIVIRPFPLIQYCHSLTFGCQCSSRIAPGFSLTCAAATFSDTGKFPESTTRTSPPELVVVGAICDILKVYWFSVSRWLPKKRLSSSSGPGSSAGKI